MSQLVLLACVSSLSCAAPEPDTGSAWGGFRGPNCSGVSASSDVPLDPERNLLWKVASPAGFSSPVVSGDRVFITGQDEKTAIVQCLDLKTGDPRWRVEAPEALPRRYGGPNAQVSSTPAADDTRLYVFFRHFGLVCYEQADGREVWRHELGPFRVPHGMSSSPVLAGGAVVMLCDQDKDSFLVAVDIKTGEERWKVDRPRFTHGYSSPVIHAPAGGPAEVIVSGSFKTCGYGLESGELRWWVDGMSWQAMTTPVIDDGVLFVHSHMGSMAEFGAPKFSGAWAEALEVRDTDGDGKISKEEWPDPGLARLWFIYDLDGDGMLGERDWDYAVRRANEGGGMFAIRLGGQGDVSGTHFKWSYTKKRGLPGVPSPLVYDGVLYMLKDGALLTSMDPATGEVFKQERLGESDDYFASPIAGGGKIVTLSHAGYLTVVRAGRDWEVLATHDLAEETWATPAIASGQLVVRTVESLYCFGDAATAQKPSSP